MTLLLIVETHKKSSIVHAQLEYGDQYFLPLTSCYEISPRVSAISIETKYFLVAARSQGELLTRLSEFCGKSSTKYQCNLTHNGTQESVHEHEKSQKITQKSVMVLFSLGVA